jgi:DNA-binding LacI/PurR family transcriptional regulator
MAKWSRLSTVEQMTAHLRAELSGGRWSGTMPGVHRLAAELAVNRKTVEAALRLLEAEGLLVPQGPGRRRRIRGAEGLARSALRVVVLLYEETDRKLGYMLDLQYRLIEAGHAASLAPKTLRSLGMDAERVARFVNETGADAWVVFGGPREVLEWFADQPVPAFALFGRRRTVRMAGTGPDKVPILLEVVRRLVALGHRKIVLLVREEQRKPQPGLLARTFLDELEVCGIPTSSYNLPDWEDSPEGFRHCLDSLFQVTSPTALIIDETFLFTVAQQHLARHGILAPEHISLVCADPDPTFAWFHPTISHIRWDSRPVVRRIVRWAANVSRGKKDLRQTMTPTEFVSGGTIGPAKEW